MTPKERGAALTTLDRQEHPQPPALEGEALSGLRCLFGETDRLLADATERLQECRGGSKRARLLEQKVSTLSELWERLRRVLEHYELGRMQGRGAS